MYVHKVQYYETDRMGVVHHSNFVRWMEEARVAFMEEGGWDYGKLEEAGVFSPVLEIRCAYRRPVTFPGDVSVEVTVREFNGVRLKLGYRMAADGGAVCEAESEHCFVDTNGKPIRLSKKFPEFSKVLEELADANGAAAE